MTPNGFNRLARPYRWMEWLTFGPALRQCRTHYLPQLKTTRDALVLGDGDGRFTAELLRTVPDAHVTAVDGSGAMLAQLKRNCGIHADRVTAHQATLPEGLPVLIAGDRYDLVATHFFLDCLTTPEVATLAQIIRPHLAANALWIVSDFAIARGFLRAPSAILVTALYRAFRILTGLRTQRLPLHSQALTSNGFELIERRSMLGGILIAELWQPAMGHRA